MAFKKNDKVFYASGGGIVRAKVVIAHRDGSCTVQAQHYYDDGKDRGPYLGFTYRLHASDVHPNAMSVSNAISALTAAAA